MSPLVTTLLLVAALCAHSGAQAQSSLLRVFCEGDSIGAEVSIDGKVKGACPLDVEVGAGTLKLRVRKGDGASERIFEEEIRIGGGVSRRVEAVLPLSREGAEAKRSETDRLAAERAAAIRRDGEKAQSASIAAFRKSAAFRTNSAEDNAEITRILSLPIENLRSLPVAGEANIRVAVANDPFFAMPDGSRKITGTIRQPGTDLIATYVYAGKGRYLQTEIKMVSGAISMTAVGSEVLGGLIALHGDMSRDLVRFAEFELTRIASVYGQPFPFIRGKRFGITGDNTKTGANAGTETFMLSCSVSPEAPGLQALAVACFEQSTKESESFTLRRYDWNDAGGCFVRRSL